MRTYSLSRDVGNHGVNRYRLLAALLAFSLSAMTNGVPALAQHSSITPDGVLSDWCFPAMLPLSGPDSLTTLACPGPAPTGKEVVWEDFLGDFFFGPVDMPYFASAGDVSSVFFAVGVTAFPADKHLQIAIEVAPGVGNSIWYNPDGASVPTLGTAAGIAADYLITTSGLTATGVLWEATTTPGVWTPVGAPFPIGVGALDFEIAIPWASFGPGACVGCPVFDPMTMPLLTVIAAHDSAAFGGATAGAPAAGFGVPFDVSDVISEPAPVTDTTAPVACPSPGTVCEHMDGSTDAFLISPPLPVDLQTFSVQ